MSSVPPQRPGLEQRWVARPLLGRALSAVIVLAPFLAATAVLWLLRVAHPHGHGPLWYVVLLSSAVAVSLVVDRVARVFLPLAALLRLTMLFPDRAPSRLRLARRAGSSRQLAERLGHRDRSASTVAEDVLALLTALGSHDKRTRGHSERIRTVLRPARRGDRPVRRPTGTGCLGSPAARRRQARGDHTGAQQARQARPRRVQHDQAAPGGRRRALRAPAAMARSVGAGDRSPPRAVGRHRLPARARRPRHLPGRPHWSPWSTPTRP